MIYWDSAGDERLDLISNNQQVNRPPGWSRNHTQVPEGEVKRSKGWFHRSEDQLKRIWCLIPVLMVRVVPSRIFGFCKESFCSDTHRAEWRLTHVPQEDEDEETDARL